MDPERNTEIDCDEIRRKMIGPIQIQRDSYGHRDGDRIFEPP